MSKPNDSRGGAIAIRGLLVQTIVALLDITNADPPFTEITLEPMVGEDQFDFLWQDVNGSHAVQVKSTENIFRKADVERWANKLQQARTHESCRLVLVGKIHPDLAKLTFVDAVAVETKNLNLDDLVEQAAHRIAVFLEDEKLGAGTAKEREMVVHALESKLQHHSTNARPISRDDFVKLLRQWIGSVPKPDAKIDISRIIKYAPDKLIGREAETSLLNDAWAKVQSQEAKRPHVLTFVALGGEGKTSLVAKWAGELAYQNWPGCEAVFAWSFYSQGTREQMAASSDLFLKEALTFFGDDEDKQFAASNAGAYEKGQRLARIVGQRQALLILDGLEPLQYAPTSPTPGELKDQGIAALLKGLAANSHGRCVVTTRYALPDLRAFINKTVHEKKLTRLSTDAGVALLQHLGVKGSLLRNMPSADGLAVGKPLWNEYEKLVEDVKGHALTLNLLGTYLRDAHAGDIRQRDLIKLVEADAEEQAGHAFHVMDAYVRWLAPTGWRAWLKRLFNAQEREVQMEGKRSLSLLSLLGLFDRPATADCLKALWQPAAIAGLTEPLIGIGEAQRNLSLKRLADAKLLTVNRAKGSGELIALDAHPLLREYLPRRVRQQQPEAWRAAHRRLYEHLCAITNEGDEPTLEDLQPLYQAIAHGCQAGLQQEAFEKLFYARLDRRVAYGWKKLGAFGSTAGALACFFELPWSRISLALKEADQGWLLNEAALVLRALGRSTESLDPMRAGLENFVKREDWKQAAAAASNLSEMELTLGEVAGAVGDAERSLIYADRSADVSRTISANIRRADAFLASGQILEADRIFAKAESDIAAQFPSHEWLPGNWGFRYDEVRRASLERWPWTRTLHICTNQDMSDVLEKLAAILHRASQRLEKDKRDRQPLLDIALDHLALGHAALCAVILEHFDFRLSTPDFSHIDAAVSGLRHANRSDHLPRALLTSAWLRSLTGAYIGPESAQSDLDEAWEIAERGSMRLFLADIHLHRARLFGSPIVNFRLRNEEAEGGRRNEAAEPYPWKSPQADLEAAEKLINDCGYHRRDAELADAKKAILGQELM